MRKRFEEYQDGLTKGKEPERSGSFWSKRYAGDSQKIWAILDELNHQPADTLEDQDLDFKEWNERSMHDSVRTVIQMAVCMANGGGGTVVFGVNDKAVGRFKAILGISPEVDLNRLKKVVYDLTDPKLTPVFHELSVPEGTGRLLVMQVYPGLPPYTRTSGQGLIRVGKECQPLTGTLRRRIMVETGETDLTANEVPEPIEALLLLLPWSNCGRSRAGRKRRMISWVCLTGTFWVPLDSSEMEDCCAPESSLQGAPMLSANISQDMSGTHLRMAGDTDYSDRADGNDAVPIALVRILDRIMADNPIATVPQGLFHFEIRTYPDFTRKIVRSMLEHTDRPVILPLSNPTSMAEAVPADLYEWTDGRALVGTGSPFPAVDYNGRVYRIGQCNNVFVFPGVGLGVLASGAREVLPEFFTAAARAVSDYVTAGERQSGTLMPDVTALGEVSLKVAQAVGETAIQHGVSRPSAFSSFKHNNDPARLNELIHRMRWEPDYLPLVAM